MASSETLKFTGRIVAGAYYDFQKLRLETMNRIRDVIRKKSEGIPFDEKEEKKEKKVFDKKYADANLEKTLETLLEEGKLNEKEYEYLRSALEATEKISELETYYRKLMKEYIQTEPIYTKFLSKIKGMGMVLPANLIKEFGNCEKYKHVSSLWKHCGLHVVDGKAPKKKKGKQLDWNPRLRTLMWKIGDQFIKQRTPYYRKVYDEERKKQEKLIEKETENAPKNKMHAHLRAMRKTTKHFLEHYWTASRELAKLPTGKPYVIEHGKHSNYVTWKDVIAEADKSG